MLAKQALLDEEKKARMQEMRRSGLKVRRGYSDIPFGVRAIQHGVEVDGIWISRPGTPQTENDNTVKMASSTTLVSESDVSFRGKGKGVAGDERADERRKPAIRNHLSESSALRGATVDTTVDEVDATSPPASPANRPLPNFSKMRQYSYSRPRHIGESAAARQRANDTYVPTGSGTRTTQSVFSATAPPDLSLGRPAAPTRATDQAEFKMPQLQYRNGPSSGPTKPEPTFGPGDLHANTASRRVNDNFEILPAGTFGPPGESRGSNAELTEGESDAPSRSSSKKARRVSKLQKQRRPSSSGRSTS